jgi:NADPH2:quinone reductase
MLTIDKTEGAAIPLAALSAAVGLYANDRLNLPQPTALATSPIPLVIYGGSSAVGSYAIRLAKRSNIHPIIAVAERARSHVEALLDASKGDTIVDYRQGDEAVIQEIKAALKGEKCHHAFDAIVSQNSFQNLSKVLELDGSSKITLVLPPEENQREKGRYAEILDGITHSMTMVGSVHEECQDLCYVFCRYFSKGLEEGWFRAHPQEEIPSGLAGIESGLKRLKDGRVSAVKFVYKVEDTPYSTPPSMASPSHSRLCRVDTKRCIQSLYHRGLTILLNLYHRGSAYTTKHKREH